MNIEIWVLKATVRNLLLIIVISDHGRVWRAKFSSNCRPNSGQTIMLELDHDDCLREV